MKKLLSILAAALFFTGHAHSQYSVLDLPRESQHATVMQRIGTTDISVNYHRPSAKGRKIWGELVPYGEVWRAGANENTTFTTSSDLTIEGQKLAAGIYGLHTIPTATTWTIIFSNDHTAWGSFMYDKKKDALRVTVTPRACAKTEQVTYDFTDVTANSATLVLRWDELEVPIKLSVDVHAVILAGMEDQLRGLSSFGWEAWYEAAKYCHDEKIAQDRAMAWVDKSIARGPNFENQTLKADMLNEQGKAAEAEALKKTMLDNATNAELNTYAYQLMAQGKKAEAVKVFELNAKKHAGDPNVHDSLGEGYMSNGQKAEAIKSFKKSLSMDPTDGTRANSIKCLKKLGVDVSAYEKTSAKPGM